MNKDLYTNHSGGAQGADMTFDAIGRKHGFNNHIHYRPKHFHDANDFVKNDIHIAVSIAAIVLKRPSYFKGIEMVYRNYFQIRDEIFAVSYIIAPGERDFKGFKNETGKEIVAGGTGWTVEMGMQREIPVFVFNMHDDKWYEWGYKERKFLTRKNFMPCIGEYNYAGIGSRQLTPKGIEAIDNLYKNTISHA